MLKTHGIRLADRRTGTTSMESAEIKKLNAGNKRLREDIAIIKGAMAFFAPIEYENAPLRRRHHRRSAPTDGGTEHSVIHSRYPRSGTLSRPNPDPPCTTDLTSTESARRSTE